MQVIFIEVKDLMPGKNATIKHYNSIMGFCYRNIKVQLQNSIKVQNYTYIVINPDVYSICFRKGKQYVTMSCIVYTNQMIFPVLEKCSIMI